MKNANLWFPSTPKCRLELKNLQSHLVHVADCEIKVHGTKVRGFKCDEVNWCLPREYLCNGIVQCPDGSDEKQEYCQGQSTPNDVNCVSVRVLSAAWVLFVL